MAAFAGPDYLPPGPSVPIPDPESPTAVATNIPTICDSQNNIPDAHSCINMYYQIYPINPEKSSEVSFRLKANTVNSIFGIGMNITLISMQEYEILNITQDFQEGIQMDVITFIITPNIIPDDLFALFMRITAVCRIKAALKRRDQIQECIQVMNVHVNPYDVYKLYEKDSCKDMTLENKIKAYINEFGTNINNKETMAGLVCNAMDLKDLMYNVFPEYETNPERLTECLYANVIRAKPYTNPAAKYIIAKEYRKNNISLYNDIAEQRLNGCIPYGGRILFEKNNTFYLTRVVKKEGDTWISEANQNEIERIKFLDDNYTINTNTISWELMYVFPPPKHDFNEKEFNDYYTDEEFFTPAEAVQMWYKTLYDTNIINENIWEKDVNDNDIGLKMVIIPNINCLDENINISNNYEKFVMGDKFKNKCKGAFVNDRTITTIYKKDTNNTSIKTYVENVTKDQAFTWDYQFVRNVDASEKSVQIQQNIMNKISGKAQFLPTPPILTTDEEFNTYMKELIYPMDHHNDMDMKQFYLQEMYTDDQNSKTDLSYKYPQQKTRSLLKNLHYLIKDKSYKARINDNTNAPVKHYLLKRKLNPKDDADFFEKAEQMPRNINKIYKNVQNMFNRDFYSDTKKPGLTACFGEHSENAKLKNFWQIDLINPRLGNCESLQMKFEKYKNKTVNSVIISDDEKLRVLWNDEHWKNLNTWELPVDIGCVQLIQKHLVGFTEISIKYGHKFWLNKTIGNILTTIKNHQDYEGKITDKDIIKITDQLSEDEYLSNLYKETIFSPMLTVGKVKKIKNGYTCSPIYSDILTNEGSIKSPYTNITKYNKRKGVKFLIDAPTVRREEVGSSMVHTMETNCFLYRQSMFENANLRLSQNNNLQNWIKTRFVSEYKDPFDHLLLYDNKTHGYNKHLTKLDFNNINVPPFDLMPFWKLTEEGIQGVSETKYTEFQRISRNWLIKDGVKHGKANELVPIYDINEQQVNILQNTYMFFLGRYTQQKKLSEIAEYNTKLFLYNADTETETKFPIEYAFSSKRVCFQRWHIPVYTDANPYNNSAYIQNIDNLFERPFLPVINISINTHDDDDIEDIVMKNTHDDVNYTTLERFIEDYTIVKYKLKYQSIELTFVDGDDYDNDKRFVSLDGDNPKNLKKWFSTYWPTVRKNKTIPDFLVDQDIITRYDNFSLYEMDDQPLDFFTHFTCPEFFQFFCHLIVAKTFEKFDSKTMKERISTLKNTYEKMYKKKNTTSIENQFLLGIGDVNSGDIQKFVNLDITFVYDTTASSPYMDLAQAAAILSNLAPDEEDNTTMSASAYDAIMEGLEEPNSNPGSDDSNNPDERNVRPRTNTTFGTKFIDKV